jgi:hypothetical protein
MVDIATGVREAGTIRKAARHELPRLAATLARAFESDPQMQWVLPDASRRAAIAERGFDLYLRKLWFEQDECYTTDGVAGAAIWNLPGRWHVPIAATPTGRRPTWRPRRLATGRCMSATASR